MTPESTAAQSTELSSPLGLTKMTGTERRAVGGLVLIYVSRMLGLFMVLPVLSAYGLDLDGATPALLGLALGVYGLMQALLQIPFGMASDRYGRKPLIALGLGVFILGSVLAAGAESISVLILGRALQGAGAVAAAVLALAADLTREEQRTKTMAILGASIGLAFVGSLVLGPLIASRWGLGGVFWVTAALGVMALLALAVVVPRAVETRSHRDAQSHWDQLGQVLKDTQLQRLDMGIFVLHALMTACFVVLPLSLIDAGVAAESHWQVYLPAVGIALVVLVPLMGLADGKGLGRQVFLVCVAALAAVQMGFALATAETSLMLMIGLFFGFFSVLEAMLPSLVSKLAPAGAKGTAMGVYSSAQFMGAFVGGGLGGLLFGSHGAGAVFGAAAVVSLLWLLLTWRIQMPARTAVLLVRTELTGQPAQAVHQSLGRQSGVLDCYLDTDSGVFHIKFDKDKTDADRLRAHCQPG